MAEAPKTQKAPAGKPAAPAPKPGAPATGPNPMLPVIAIALILGGAIWMTYSIMTEPPPKKTPGGGH